MSWGVVRAPRLRRLAHGWLLLGLAAGCSAEHGPDGGGDAGQTGAEWGGAGGDANGSAQAAPYAQSVESFEPGEGAGYNQALLPGIVLGPPKPKGGAPSLDVVSLGSGGEIVVGFGALGIVDGPGADLVVFENPFWPGGDSTQVYAELGEVSVSEDGEAWHAFPCDSVGDGAGRFPGCAGFTPTQEYDALTLLPLDPTRTGGDAFDLADLGLSRARFVKIRDLKTLEAAGTTSGFDLDAVGVVHAE